MSDRGESRDTEHLAIQRRCCIRRRCRGRKKGQGGSILPTAILVVGAAIVAMMVYLCTGSNFLTVFPLLLSGLVWLDRYMQRRHQESEYGASPGHHDISDPKTDGRS